MASGGRAQLPTAAQGTGTDTEPLWPTWLAKPVIVSFVGWRKVHAPLSELTYRPPADAKLDAAPIDFSQADTVGVDTNRRAGTLYVDNIAWGGDNSADDGQIVDDFEQPLAAWRTHGTPEALNAVQYSSSPLAKAGTRSMKLDFTAVDAATTQKLTYLGRVVAASKDPCVIFVPGGAFDRETADALPQEGDFSNEINTFACPDQIQAASFTLYAKTALSHVKVTQKYPLGIAGYNMPKSAVNLHIVKMVKSHGVGPLRDPDATTTVQSMLVKDDRIPLVMTGGLPPEVRLTGDPQTDIPAHTQKQFWVTISVPANTPPGKYTGVIEVSSDQFASQALTLNVDVLPIRLMAPSKQYAIDYRGKLGGSSTPETATITDGVSPERFAMELKDISDHGVRYTTLRDQGDNLWKSVTIYNNLHMGYPFVYEGWNTIDDVQALEQQRIAKRASPFYYMANDPSELATLKDAGVQTAVRVPAMDVLAANKKNIDLALYPVDIPVIASNIAQNGVRSVKNRDWLWWTAAQPNPHLNRFYTGVLLWRANLYGAIASDYQTAYETDPFDDLAQPAGKNAPYRPQMLTYPTQDGLISTIQWEAIREGITDARYLTTYYAAYRECKDAHVAPDLVNTSFTQINAFLSKPLASYSDVELQKGRLLVANYAVRLRLILDAYYKTHPLFGSTPAPK
jgi:hypothetical protein